MAKKISIKNSEAVKSDTNLSAEDIMVELRKLHARETRIYCGFRYFDYVTLEDMKKEMNLYEQLKRLTCLSVPPDSP